ncbi:MAG: hypothetical protein A3G39_08380 [Deltaproteobacteria bacterium RIFCSPLOWO2_12_FULL_43_16]|nr:MAG: hypothetical protein A2Z89_10785 [Deltaproteobacteria bacterium GWA2_43_19]OGQ57500.1 MAG: hypothetical protein A3G39_08380 [Deltaproteobacteria bacterium RIFCSPLOWO2_12_FULL_43_16]
MVSINRLKKIALPAVILAIFLGTATSTALKKSNTWDESAHILAGYSYLKDGNDGLSPLNHPVFGRATIALLPRVLLNLDYDSRVKPEEAPGSNFFPYSLKFLFENKVDGKNILLLSRLSIILLGALLGAYVYVWSKELWGTKGAVLSLVFYALCPNIIANSSLATTDMPVTAFFFISVFYLYRMVTMGVTIKGALIAAIFTAFALTSKHTALLLALIIAFAFLLNLRTDGLKKTILCYAVLISAVYILIWAVYAFRYQWSGPYYVPLFWDKFAHLPVAPLFAFLRKIHFLPEAYLYSINGTLAGAGAGRAAFLMGEYSSAGWWYYFIVAFIIKTPIPTLLFLTAALVYMSTDRENLKKTVFLVLPALVIFTAISMQKVNIGFRHVLPAYPFIFTLIGYVPGISSMRKKAARVVFYGFIVWYLYGAAFIHPDELAYFNEFVGGPKNGYKYLVDSNLDWGQDLIGLKKYIDEHKIEKIKLSYFGFSDPAYYGIKYEYLPSYAIPNPHIERHDVPLKGYFAISATMLQGVYLSDRDFYKVFRDVEPIDTIGYSIFIYKF